MECSDARIDKNESKNTLPFGVHSPLKMTDKDEIRGVSTMEVSVNNDN